ncbi:DNA excision repair protein ercc-6-like [Plakobranchus ocellatus]|uniref:DNA excision repair protein ercc-6-like n=1 Tax=Plakobranchus ocellatus TaxID=259542 RepID=A0AAV4AS92_9GAST|nr:DNA excision repair protein ercc-6-like [Plakobranchus ocellatus]
MDLEEKLATISIKEEKDVADESSKEPKPQAKGSSESETEADSEARKIFMKYVTEGRRLVEEGDIARAIKLNEKALAIRYSEKLQKRIEKMKAFLAAQEEDEGENGDDDEEDGGMKSLGQGFMLHHKLYGKLYQHQKEGVLWMWSLYVLGKGGILADDMGLGKTIQVIAFLAGMFDMGKIKSVMIVVPLSVIPNWLNEFNKWTPGINVMQFHGSSKKERDRALHRVRSRGGVLMTTYGLVVTTHETLSKRHGQEFVWDYVILDEGHKIKNPTKTSKSIHHVPARMRMILTGTPVQNNLKELWSLFDYVHQGSLLGTMRTFKMEFETPIIRARERDATAVAKRLGQEMAETLKGIIKPYFLRRTKAEVTATNASDKDSDCMKMPSMMRKNDLVIWLHLTEAQQKIYKDFINLDSVKQLLMTKKSPLVALTVLKKICDHPRLLSKRACMQLGLDGDDFDDADLEHPEAYESAVLQINNIPDEVLVAEAGKMQILVQLLDTFKAEGRKTLVFSQSRRMLDIIQKVITNRGHKVSRLDGTVTQLMERDEIVKRFQKDPSYTVFLLTVQVGGVGLTITSADRVIIYDPNWNPATDAQAVDRAYRIGQQKNVVVYRLITCGTVEEKIYRRQVFKDSITRQTTGASKNPYRYFTSVELRELFALDDPMTSTTQRQLQEMHAGQRKTDTALDEHIAYLHSLDIFGISDHDLMFHQTQETNEEEENEFIGEEEIQRDQQFIQHKIRMAQTLIAEESQNPFAAYEERTKGGMRYPPTARPVSGAVDVRPSPLFSLVPPAPIDEVLISDEEEDANKSLSGSSNDREENSFVDLTEDESKDASKSIQKYSVLSPPKKIPKTAISSPAKNSPGVEKPRRALQPLSTEEVKMRSPTVLSSSRKGTIVTEELLISPDVASPVIGLEKVDIRRRMMEEEAQRKAGVGGGSSAPSSPRRTPMSPKSAAGAGVGSPLRGGQRTPSKLASSPARALLQGGSPSWNLKSPGGQSHQIVQPVGTLSTPTASKAGNSAEVLETDSPADLFKSPSSRTGCDSKNNSLSATSPALTPSLNLSDARRKLSFVVAESPISPSASQSGVQSRELTPQKLSQTLCIGDGGEDKSRLRGSVAQIMSARGDSGHLGMSGAASPTNYLSPKPRVKEAKNKRRSVCLQQLPPRPVGEESSEDSDLSPDNGNTGQTSSDEDENKENASVEAEEEKEEEDKALSSGDGEEETDEENKENEGMNVGRGLGGRNRIVSESESSEGSCFEVPLSEDEDGQGHDDSDAENEGKLGTDEQGVVSHDRGDKEEEDEEMTEEENQQFQELISAARQQYKQKHYEDSLLYVNEALKICRDPGLEEMAEKIRFRIANQNA